MISKSSKVIAALSIALAASPAMASGYGIKLGNAKALGMAYAGSGVMDDPLSIYSNPAVLGLFINHEIAGHFTGVFGSTKFSGRASTTGAVAPATGPFLAGAYSQTGTTRNAAKKVAVPSFALVANAHDRLKVGVMVHTPFGLKFDYRPESITRGHGVRASMRTISVVPSFALKIVDALTVGAGLQMQYTKVDLTRKVALKASHAALINTLDPYYSYVTGDNWSMGWTAGLLAQITKAWKVGFSYKSKLDASLDGQGEIASLTGSLVDSFAAKAKVYFPQIFTLSTSYDLTNSLTAYMDVTYTKWDIVRDITITSFRSTTSQDVIPLRWKNSWFASVGASYKLNDNWSLRAGYAYDAGPSRDGTRVVSIPDANKHWLAVGGTYNMGPNLSMTFSYGHEFFEKGKINLSQGAGTAANSTTFNKGSLVGKVKNRVDLISAQFNYKF